MRFEIDKKFCDRLAGLIGQAAADALLQIGIPVKVALEEGDEFGVELLDINQKATRLFITNEGMAGADLGVFLDGREVAGLTSIEIKKRWQNGDPASVTLSLLPIAPSRAEGGG